jgi:signal transduction histidine kinase
VRDLLELARLDARLFSHEPATVELDELVAACVDGFGPEAASAGVGMEVLATPAVVTGDPDRLAQVVANLLENALRFASSRVVVTVATDAGSGRARVTVEDDGPGIDPADRDHVFERLYAARHHPTRRESGSGLGLAIVRELVVAMGGTVGVESTEAGGARLWFELPLEAGGDG